MLCPCQWKFTVYMMPCPLSTLVTDASRTRDRSISNQHAAELPLVRTERSRVQSLLPSWSKVPLRPKLAPAPQLLPGALVELVVSTSTVVALPPSLALVLAVAAAVVVDVRSLMRLFVTRWIRHKKACASLPVPRGMHPHVGRNLM